MVRLAFLFVCIAGCTLALHGQAHPLSFRHLTPNDGLSDGKVLSISQDPEGYLWFGTGYGLNRFNGYDVEHFMSVAGDSTSISNQQVYHQLVSAAGRMYFNGRGIANRFRQEDQRFERWCFGRDFRIGVMCETRPGEIWLGTTRGLARFSESTAELLFLKDIVDSLSQRLVILPVQELAFDGSHKLYAATAKGLLELDLDVLSVRQYVHEDGNQNSIPSDDVRQVVVDRSGMIWLSTDYYGSRLCRLDPVSGRGHTYDVFHFDRRDWADNRIMDILVDDHNRVWVASLRAGIGLFRPESNDFTFSLHDPLQPTSISSNSIFCLFQDQEGMIWAGTEGYGVDYFHPDRNYFSVVGPSAFSQPTLADNWCRTIAVDQQGYYWIGTYKGLSRWDPVSRTYKNYLLAEQEFAVVNNSVRSVVVDDDGKIWIGTGGGLNILDPQTDRMRGIDSQDSLDALFISFILKDRDGRMWVCTPNGLYVYHRASGKFRRLFQDRPDLASVNFVNLFQGANGSFWASLGQKGMVRFNPDLSNIRVYPMEFLNPESNEYDFPVAVTEDSHGMIWIGTNGGLVALDAVADTAYVYTEAQGLPSNKVSEVLCDLRDRVWFATGNGLCVMDVGRRWVTCFDVHDGLPTNYLYEGTASRLPDGTFAYPSYAGVVLFDPERIHPEPAQVSVLISRFSIAGKPTIMDRERIARQGIRLQHDENFFSIELTGLYFENPGRIRYTYLLEGFDRDWHETKERFANYTNVPGGDYRFHYRAELEGRPTQSPEHVLPLHIDTVYYATWWFRIGAILLLLGIVIAFFRWRLREQAHIHLLEGKAQQLEKEKAMVHYEGLKQQLNPHFLFNSLTSLRSMIRVDQKLAGEFLDMMSSIYRYILRNREHELVSLKDELSFARTFIELQRTRFSEGLEVIIDVPEETEHRRIAPVTLQNLIENAIKHNRIDPDSPLVIHIGVEEDFLVISNNLQRKDFVETSNKQGLAHLISLYRFFDQREVTIEDTGMSFIVRIPLL